MADHIIYSLTADDHRRNAAKLTEEIAGHVNKIAELEEQRRLALAIAALIEGADRTSDRLRPESVDLFPEDAQHEVDPYETQVPESDMGGGHRQSEFSLV